MESNIYDMYRRNSQITNFGVQKLTINLFVTNKVHINEIDLLIVLWGGFRRQAFILAALNDAVDFFGEPLHRIVPNGILAGNCLNTDGYGKISVYSTKPFPKSY